MAEDKETFYPVSTIAWRKWLKKNHVAKQSVWVVCYKMNSGKPSIPWSQLVDEALCFGWIDSIRKSTGNDQYIQFFTKRKPKSAWSKINKAKIEELTEQGRMMQAGYDSIAVAKQNGSWSMLDAVEELKMPKDLAAALRARAGAQHYFESLSKSVKKQLLQWVIFAKRTETRQKRIEEIVKHAAKKKRPKQF